MLKKCLALSCFCLLLIPASGIANTATVLSKHGNWTAYSFSDNGETVCYMASEPIADSGNYKIRGEISALITHWPAKNSKNVFSYVAGYSYKKGSDVDVNIGGRKFSLFTQGEMAWSADEETDEKLITAIKAGSQMVVKGTSSRGTLTTDTFQLTRLNRCI